MYDQWNTSESSPPLSPSTLAASALGGVIGSAVAATSEPQTETCIAVESSEPTNAQEQTSSSKKGRTHSRERKGGHWRGKAKENTKQTEGEARSEVSKAPSEQQNASENKKGISWGGQEKKAGGALAAVGGASEAPIPEKEGRGGGRGSGSGRTRSRGSNGRGGRGPGQDAAPAATSSSLGETNQTQGESGRRAGRGSRGRGRGSAPSRGGRSGGRTQPTPQATT